MANQAVRIDLAGLQGDATVGCRVIYEFVLKLLMFAVARYSWWLVRISTHLPTSS